MGLVGAVFGAINNLNASITHNFSGMRQDLSTWNSSMNSNFLKLSKSLEGNQGEDSQEERSSSESESEYLENDEVEDHPISDGDSEANNKEPLSER